MSDRPKHSHEQPPSTLGRLQAEIRAHVPARDDPRRSHAMKYRPDIDGLRALAVLPVVAFHIGVSRVPGGYVGVDVFFVISGYLISAIMLRELSEGRFSIVSFYERRVRRIAPALIAMLTVTTAFACWYLLPEELADYGRSLVAAVLSLSNFLFWHEVGYFDLSAAGKPLLHTWSLAVEEQFYLVMPLLLVLTFRHGRRLLTPLIWAMALVSLSLSAAGVFFFPEAAFYLPWTRAWELLLGTLLALHPLPHFNTPLRREAGTLCGIVLILAAVLTYTASTPFPGIAALIPCLGAALVIAAGKTGSSLTGRLLSLAPVVFIGRISYSLYLWHWPVILFQRIASAFVDGTDSRSAKVAMGVISLLLAIVSWWCIERPFRSRRPMLARRAVFAGAFACAAMFVTVGASLDSLGGIPGRFPLEAMQYSRYLTYGPQKFRMGQCFITPQYTIDAFDTATCLQADRERENDLILGDSLAAHLWFGFSEVFEDVHFLQATASGCKPMVTQPAGMFVGPCSALMTAMFRDFLPNHPPGKLLIGAHWAASDLPSIAETLLWAAQHRIRVVLLGPMVEYDSALPRLLAFSVESGDNALPGRHEVDGRPLDKSMATMARQMGAEYVSFYDLLCTPTGCQQFSADRMPLQFDYGHLTGPGSVLVAQMLQAAWRAH
jgi:peptidoglycan/LPS O-acetylase OafA/YrhL